jgi:hypothetical protein
VIEASLIEAVHAGDVGAVAERALGSEGSTDELRRRIVDACRTIGVEIAATRDTILARLSEAGVEAAAPPLPTLPQRRELRLEVADFPTAEQAANALEADGFERWQTWTKGARRSFASHATDLTVARTDHAPAVVRISWKTQAARTRRQRIVTPTAGDWQMITLPTRAWRVYPMIRIVRLVAEALRLRRRHEGTLAPFLATPASLLAPLLHEAGTAPDDVVIDLGCGDGRLPVAAAIAGSHSIGIERSPELARRARQRADDAGVAGRVTIVIGDAREAALDRVDVVFAFLPTDALADLLPSILHRMRPGSRLIAHEQNRLPSDLRPRPTTSRIVVSDDAITVAHRWEV